MTSVRHSLHIIAIISILFLSDWIENFLAPKVHIDMKQQIATKNAALDAFRPYRASIAFLVRIQKWNVSMLVQQKSVSDCNRYKNIDQNKINNLSFFSCGQEIATKNTIRSVVGAQSSLGAEYVHTNALHCAFKINNFLFIYFTWNSTWSSASRESPYAPRKPSSRYLR